MPLSAYRVQVVLIYIFIFHCKLDATGIDTIGLEMLSFHAQTTIISQNKPSFYARYTGENSLGTASESRTSITSTLFAGVHIWKGASIFVNPEIAGGSGLSSALGIGAATNGETFRIGDPAPQLYLARVFFHQVFSLSTRKAYAPADFNQLAEYVPQQYIGLTLGKISVADFFDDNKYSHGPRSQFMSWGLMSNGAWDYPANTRGYTPGIVTEYVSPNHEIRYAFALMPIQANGLEMNWNIAQAGAHQVEYTFRYALKNRPGAFRILGFFNKAKMGNYTQSIRLRPVTPDILATRDYGNHKYGFAFSAEQDFNQVLGGFLRGSWNDGKNETWCFTEIDHSISTGISLSGNQWHREQDHLCLAFVASGLSKEHQAYLKAGGKGFILGDGKLNYSWEKLTELYYTTALVKDNIFLTGAYQFVLDPGYNRDRQGPVHIFSMRLHARI